MKEGPDGSTLPPVAEGGDHLDRVASGATAGCSSAAQEGLPASYLIVHNVSKRHNIGTLARSAVAFGVTEVVIAFIPQCLSNQVLPVCWF